MLCCWEWARRNPRRASSHPDRSFFRVWFQKRSHPRRPTQATTSTLGFPPFSVLTPFRKDLRDTIVCGSSHTAVWLRSSFASCDCCGLKSRERERRVDSSFLPSLVLQADREKRTFAVRARVPERAFLGSAWKQFLLARLPLGVPLFLAGSWGSTSRSIVACCTDSSNFTQQS